MRKVSRDAIAIPEGLKSPAVEDARNHIARTGDKDQIRAEVYKDAYRDAEGKTQSRVRDRLNEVYHDKCAYCERFCKAEIEHYRPKKAVKEAPEHPGYYWLCYEWTNLLPACRYCNTEGGKGNQFPVRGTRVAAPPLLAGDTLDTTACDVRRPPLRDEQPYLLHPEIDEPAAFLAFEVAPDKTGVKIRGIDTEGRGAETLRICNLNRRELMLERLDILQQAKKSLLIIIDLFRSENREHHLPKALGLVFQQLSDNAADPAKTHTLLRTALIASPDGFTRLVAPLIEDGSTRELIVMAWEQYLARA